MSKDEVAKLGPLGLRLVEGLRGQAFRIAQRISHQRPGIYSRANNLAEVVQRQLEA